MRKLITAAVLLIISNVTFAQKGLPEFGKIDKEDLQMKECDIDKDAVAYKLIDYGDVYYMGGGSNLFTIVTEKRIRIKILKDKGLEYSNVKLRYFSGNNYHDITNVTGVTYNIDDAGNVVTTKLDKSAIFKKSIDKEFSEVAFTLPNVKIGSVIEFKYKETNQNFEHLDDWNFQDYIPTRISKYQITIPAIFRFVTQELVFQQLDKKKDDYGSMQSLRLPDGRIFNYNTYNVVYTLKDVPSLPDEPFMSSPKDYAERIVFQLSQIVVDETNPMDVHNTWPKLVHDLMGYDDFGEQLRKNVKHTGSLDDSIKIMKGDYNKMTFIYDYVQRNMTWDGIDGIFSFEGIKSAWDKKSGNDADINFILIHLLRDAGITVYPLLVSTRDHGAVNTLFPFMEQFNAVMALAIVNGQNYVLNAADKYNPADLVPLNVLNNEAYIVDEQNGQWVVLNDDKAKFENIVSINSEISTDGILSGNATVYSTGYNRNLRLKEWVEDKKDFKENYFTKAFTGIKVNDLEVANENVDTLPLEQKVTFSIPLNVSGDYEHFSLNLFQGLEKNPFIADKRVTDIDFGYKQDYQIVGTIFLPDGYQLDELPKNIQMIMPDTSIVLQRIIQADTVSLQFRITIKFNKTFYTANDYPYFKEFYKKLFETLNEEVVLKKKTTP